MNNITTMIRPIPRNGPKCSKTPDVWHGLDLDWHPDLCQVIRAIVAWYQQDRETLVLGGGCGCGKTHLAKVVLEACGGPVMILVEQCPGQWLSIRNAVFYAEANLLSDIRQSYRGFSQDEDKIINDCRCARMLILDDVGVGYVRDESQRWYEDIMWRIFDTRAENYLPTLLTTNLTPPELKTRLGERAYSRLRQMMGSRERFVNMFAIPDYRAKGW